MIMGKVSVLYFELLSSFICCQLVEQVIVKTFMISIVGGTFALYSLICRYANVNMLPNRQQADEHISSYRLKLPTPELARALKIKETLERRSSLKTLLLLLVLLGTSMIIGDGILTPAISGTLLHIYKDWDTDISILNILDILWLEIAKFYQMYRTTKCFIL